MATGIKYMPELSSRNHYELSNKNLCCTDWKATNPRHMQAMLGGEGWESFQAHKPEINASPSVHTGTNLSQSPHSAISTSD